MKRNQGGLTTIEFTLVGSMALALVFGCIEIARVFFIMNAMTEATRRGARVAAVADVATAKTAAVAQAAHLPDFTTANVTVNYFSATGAAAGGPADPATVFVTVAITDYTHSFVLPGMDAFEVDVPPLTTTLPVESMGFGS